MSFDSKTLPDSFKRCMEPATKKSLGHVAMTVDEIKSKNNKKRESELQHNCGLLLDHKGIIYNRSDMRCKTTCRPGWPDFTFALNGKACAIECKVGHNTLTEEQSQVINHMLKNGWLVGVAHNEEHFLYFIDKWSKQQSEEYPHHD